MSSKILQEIDKKIILIWNYSLHLHVNIFANKRKKLCYIFVTDILSSCTLSLSLSLSDFSLIFSCSAAATFCIISGWASTHFWKRSCNYHEKNSEKQTDWKRDRQTNRQINWQMTLWLKDWLNDRQTVWLTVRETDRMTEWMNDKLDRKTDRQRKEKDHGGKKLESKTRGKGVNEWKRKLSKEVTMQVVK